MQYTVYEFYTRDELERNWLISILTENAFEGFEETSEALKAFVPSAEITSLKVTEILFDNDFSHIEFTSAIIEEKNWNEEWEKNFEPVIIAEQVAIRAPFHLPIANMHELIIEPKMSFGTGHHATTASMIQLMLTANFENKSVLDFGSGTGILAILAEKLKATKIIAIDNEEWAYHNCIENIERNNCVTIRAVKGDDTYIFHEKFEIILANINRNVILKNMRNWKSLLQEKGLLIVSGILDSDEQDIINEAQKNELAVKEVVRTNGWLAISFN